MIPKIVLIGTGRFGNNHLRNLVDFDKIGIIKLIGVVDTDSNRLKKIKKEYSITTSEDYRDFLNTANAFDVVTPASTHFSLVKSLLLEKKHVFVEKPLTLNYFEAVKLVKLAKKNNVTFQVGLIFRYNEMVTKLKKLIRNKNYFPFYVTGSFLQNTPPKSDVGAIFNYLHHFDIIDNLFGQKIKSIFSHENLSMKNPHLETNVTVMMDLTNNVNVVLNLGWIPTGKYRTLELFSKKYHLKCDLMKQQIEIYQNEKLNKVIKPKFKEPLKLELEEFVNCIKNKKKSKADGYIGARVVKIAEAATKSLKTKKPLRFR